MSVDKAITRDMLADGEIRLSQKEADSLGLPPSAENLKCFAGGTKWLVSWSPRSLKLVGEQLRDYLQDYGTVGGVLRLSRSSGFIELQCVSPVTGRFVPTMSQSPMKESGGSPARPIRRFKRRDPKRLARRLALRNRQEYDWENNVGIHTPTLEEFADVVNARRWASSSLFELYVRGQKLSAATHFDKLLAVHLARIDHMPHQEATALKVLREMDGRAVLADEVGLGKTIEAGLIMKELVVRGLARRVLILCPAGLREQWHEELRTKFDENFQILRRTSDLSSQLPDRVIMSLNLARSNLDTIRPIRWDLVIVDEAHKEIKGSRTRQLLAGLKTTYMLFLTATPVQNSLIDLYYLVDLLRPGTFATRKEFNKRFVDANNPRQPIDAAGLRRLASAVMVRSTRQQVGLDRVRRNVVDFPVKLSATERKIYKVLTNGLRTLMTGPGDRFRRRNLAHRLTASPRSLAATAGRIASKHTDERVRRFLNELSEQAIAIERTSRHALLLEVLKQWIEQEDKGKVVVFTQHTDTLDDLARILEEEKIEAAVYHGGLSSAARGNALTRFRRKVPVLISTDTGAEGLNLQFANCIVNYDLPWNPMKIEQRIGRVHRLTQPKDQIYVANFFATRTIDEYVYTLLRDKLRMFELLFGQITTVLGELEPGKGNLTFEEEVLEAYLSPDDSEMGKKLAAFGERLERAFDNTRQALALDAGISSWYIDQIYRENIRKRPAEELRPAVGIKERRLQKQVFQFACDFFKAFGANLIKVSDNIYKVALPKELQDEFAGQEVIYLAFSPSVLEHHRNAELCAVGSNVFEQILSILAERSRIHASMPLVEIPQVPWLQYAPGLRFQGRVALGPAGWAATAFWRARYPGFDTSEELIQVDFGNPATYKTKHHRDLAASVNLPKSLPKAAQILEIITSEAARKELEKLRDRAQRDLTEHIARAQEHVKRMERRAQELMVELSKAWDTDRERLKVEQANLQAQLNAYKSRYNRKVEVTAELSALSIVGSPALMIQEKWVDALGREFSIQAEWTPGMLPENLYYRDSKGKRITYLAVCSNGHPVDISLTKVCAGCDTLFCYLCRKSTVRQCPACGASMCRACWSVSLGICRWCAAATRSPELDRYGHRAWSLGFGTTALVGEAVARILRPDGSELVVSLDQTEDVGLRWHLTAIASSLGCQLDLGAELVRLSQPQLPENALELHRNFSITWEIDPAGGSTIDNGIASYLPRLQTPGEAPRKASSALRRFIASLKDKAPPESAPRIVARETWRTRYLLPRDGEIWLVEEHRVAGQKPVVRKVPLQFIPDDARGSKELRACAVAPPYRVEVLRLHRSALVDIFDTRNSRKVMGTLFVAGTPDATFRAEKVAAEIVRERGLPPNAVLFVKPRSGSELSFARPSEAILIERQVQEEKWILQPGAAGRPFQDEDLDFADTCPEGVERTTVLDGRGWTGFLAAVGLLGETSDPYTLVHYYRIAETWQGTVSATRTYLVAPDEPAYPLLDDTGKRGYDFGIDSAGHLHEPGSARRCPVCEQLLCRACWSVSLGICRWCAAATRSPELDRDGHRAWSLGFGTTALVGEAVARILRPDGSELVVSLDQTEDVGLRWHLTAIASSLGCQLDLGAELVRLSQPQLPENALELHRNFSITWEIDPAGGSTIDNGIASYLPRLQTPGEAPRKASSALRRFIASLKDKAPPESAPRIVARETWRTRYLLPRDGEIWLVEEHRVAGQKPVVRKVPLQFIPDDARGSKELRACAVAPPYRVEVLRLHRSALVDIFDTRNSRKVMGTLFVAGTPDATFRAEKVAAEIVRERGLPPNAVLFVKPRSGSELSFARPSEAILIERQVQEEKWILQPGAAGRPFQDEDLDFADTCPEGVERTTVLDGRGWTGFLAAVGLLGETSDPYTLVHYYRIAETWQGTVSATRTYLVAPDEPAYPLLDDTGKRGYDFGIDSAGHLHEPGSARRCPVCEQLLCRACWSVSLGICRWCAAATRSPELDRDGHRAWSLGFGTTALVGEAVARILRPDGSELVVSLDQTEDVGLRWHLTAIASSLGCQLDLGAELVRLSQPQLPENALELHRNFSITWEIDPAGGSTIDNGIASYLPRLQTPGEAPRKASSALRRFIASLKDKAPPESAPRIVARETWRTRYLLPRDGEIWLVEEHRVAGQKPVVRKVPLQVIHNDAVQGWGIAPDKSLSASIGNIVVCLARIGPAAVCAYEKAGSQYLIQLGEPDVRLAKLCDRLGIARAKLRVGSVITPEEFQRPALLGGELLPSFIRLAWVRQRCQPSETALEKALQTWVEPGSLGRLADLAKIVEPAEVIAALRETLGCDDVPVDEGIVGLRIQEAWRVGTGVRTVEYVVDEPGAAKVRAEDTGQAAHELYFDRAAHLVENPRTCPYCNTLTCRLCHDGVSPCNLCQIDICSHCVFIMGGIRLCGACRCLSRVGPVRSSKQYRIPGPVLLGADKVHQVMLYPRKNGAELVDNRTTGECIRRELSLTVLQAEVLNRIAGQRWFVARVR